METPRCSVRSRADTATLPAPLPRDLANSRAAVLDHGERRTVLPTHVATAFDDECLDDIVG
jgi:hypothetical protein